MTRPPFRTHHAEPGAARPKTRPIFPAAPGHLRETAAQWRAWRNPHEIQFARTRALTRHRLDIHAQQTAILAA